MSYTVGSLVRVRGREWVVLPNTTSDLLHLRPIGGTDDEETVVYTALETIEPATFSLPDPKDVGDHRSAQLLRDAVRLGFRSSAGPFRSFASINVEPRSYQLVPLLMALKQDPIRLLIADDVGIGKTVEALLIAREMLDRGEIDRVAVLCPPQLAEQWQEEMRDKFYMDAELVLSSTATRLERGLRLDESLFEHHPIVVVSTDFIKFERRRDDFIRTAPEFVIVDEAHSVAHTTDKQGGKHLRYELVKKLAEDESRHILLVTATPHSGKEDAFRSLLSILRDDFASLPDDLTGKENEAIRQTLAQYFVQRRRGDIKSFADQDTFFPERDFVEATYELSPEYAKLFNKVITYARETVRDPEENQFKKRVRWWSALALLRSLASSPLAAATTLRNRAATVDAPQESPAQADEIGRKTVMDTMDEDSAESIDVAPGGQIEDHAANPDAHKRRLKQMAQDAEALAGEKDTKLQNAIAVIKDLVRDGYSPIVFCRFIPTVHYLVEHLRDQSRGVEIMGITGSLPPAEREKRIEQLVEYDKRILVCTDCLSEGINLQGGFDAVMHYDLSWNPTRHEQREGRVDRYGQNREQVKIVTYYGVDNQIDGIVLDVLIRKHHTIRNSLGISVPIPGDPNQIAEAVLEGLILREDSVASSQLTLPDFDDLLEPKQLNLLDAWDQTAAREKRSQTMFAQYRLKPEDVLPDLHAARAAVGSGVLVEEFLSDAVQTYGGHVSRNGVLTVDLREAPRGLREMLGKERFKAAFELPVPDDTLHLTRTHPLVEALATYVMDSALDTIEQGAAKRAGAIRTSAVDIVTTLILVRFRYHIITYEREQERQLLAEDSALLAFRGSATDPTWLDGETAEALLTVEPDANISPGEATRRVSQVVEAYPQYLEAHVIEVAEARAQQLYDAHRRVRESSQRTAYRGMRYEVEPQLPPDVLGIYVFLPKPMEGLF